MADNFDLRKYITEAKLNIKVPVKEMARIAKEKYALNSDFPNLEDRISNPSNYKNDRKQQVINYFVAQAKEQNVDPMDVELFKSEIEKNSAPGVNWSFTPDIRTQLLQVKTAKSEKPDEETGGEDYFGMGGKDAEDLFVGRSKLSTKKGKPIDGDEFDKEPSAKDLAKFKKAPITGTRAKAGEWLIDNGDLIDRIIKKYSRTIREAGRSKGGDEAGDIGAGQYRASLQKSREAAKAELPNEIAKIVGELEKIESQDYDLFIKILQGLDFKFGTVNAKGAMKLILKGLGLKSVPESGSKKALAKDLKKLGIDDEPIELGDEEA
jgi:hypothetical protein